MVVSAEESAYRLPMCPNCQKGGMLTTKTYYGKWEPTGKLEFKWECNGHY